MSPITSERKGPLGLGLLILLVLSVHGWMITNSGPARLWGDEPMYAENAAQDAPLGETSLLPGQLPFRTRPEFGARLLANLNPGPGLLRSAAWLQLGLLALTLAMVYAQARLLELRPGFALLAAALLGCFPWLGFHVHSLWPEVLHSFFVAVGLLGVLLALVRGRRAFLVPAGVSLGLALFTKGVMQPFVLLFAGVVAWSFARRAKGSQKPWLAGALAAALLLGSTYALLAPQLIANAPAGHGAQLASNRWWNLELGLCAEPREGRSVAKLQKAYFAASQDPREREAQARQRTLAHLRSVGLVKALGDQWTKLQRLLWKHESSFERSLDKMQRWGPDPPAALEALAGLGRGMWYALLSMGGLGALWLGRRSAGWFLVSSFALGFFLAGSLIPLKVRFLLPMIPFLCLLTAGLLQALWLRARATQARA